MNEYVDEETVLQFQVSNSAEMPFQGSAISSDNEAIKCFEGHSPNRGVQWSEDRSPAPRSIRISRIENSPFGRESNIIRRDKLPMSQQYMFRHKPVTSKLILKQLEHTVEQRETTEIDADKTAEQNMTSIMTTELQDEEQSR